MKIKYPFTKKSNHADDYFGTVVPDPYRWLEDDNSIETKDWVAEQNKLTFDYLDKIPFRHKIKDRLSEILNYPRYSAPFRAGHFYFFDKNNGLQNQNVMYIQEGPSGNPEVFLDPNILSDDGTTSITRLGISKDKKYLAYAINHSGSDWQEIRVIEISTKKQLQDRLSWVKFSGAAWKDDGFYYSRYDKPPDGQEYSGQNVYHKIYYHKLGDTQEMDTLIFEDKNHPLRYFSAETTEDERFLIISSAEGTSGNELFCKDLTSGDLEFSVLVSGFEYDSYILNNAGGMLFMLTNHGAPNKRIVAIDPKNPAEAHWKVIVPETPHILEGASTGGRQLFVSYLIDVSTRVYAYDFSGQLNHEIKLPGLGTATGFGGWEDDQYLFYNFSSFTYPPAIYKYEIATGRSTIFRSSEVKFNPLDFEVQQVFYPSKDNTKIPMFIVHKRGLKKDGTNPVLLYGYGGFNVSLTPGFSASRIVLLENGGVFAMPNLRGGGEYGKAWHEAGKLLKKQNVFDDFIAAAEYLINEKITSPEKIAIQGGSNGGLLVGACMLQRPDLFQVAFPQVGVLDMLRYHKFTVGWGWAVEYGLSDKEDHFPVLYGYSPLHNIKPGVSYPATMITTADHDDRVVPAHSFKFAATLQEKHSGNNPILIRIEVRSGHGAGKPISKLIEESADTWSFMFYQLGIVPEY